MNYILLEKKVKDVQLFFRVDNPPFQKIRAVSQIIREKFKGL